MEDLHFDSPLRVLVVEDSADGRETTALLLQLWDCDARMAAGGPATLDLAVDYHPDVVLPAAELT